MEEKTTMEITNDRLEEAIKDYAADRTKEKLTAVLNLLRPTKLLVPAMLKAPDHLYGVRFRLGRDHRAPVCGSAQVRQGSERGPVGRRVL